MNRFESPLQSLQNGSASRVSAQTWAQSQPVPQVLSSEGLGWKDVSLYRFRQPAKWRLDQPPVGEHLVVVQLAHHSRLKLHVPGDTYSEMSGPGSVAVMGACQENSWIWDHQIDEIHLLLKPAVVDDMAEELFGKPVELRSGVGLQDPWIYQMAMRLMADVESRDGACRLLGDIMAKNLAHQLLMGHARHRAKADCAKRSMSRGKLRCALDFIEESLGTDISVDDIARELGMSTFHFMHCFKADMGVSPYQYVVKTRLVRAAALLRSTELTIGKIALDLGFSSQSHFTTAFRKEHGTTPSSYRQQYRS